MSTENQAFDCLNKNTLTRQEGMDRTNNWREAVKGLFGDDYEKIPRGFYIKMEDINDLATLYQDYNPSGVRVYFTFHSAQPPYNEVTGILVPVVVEEQGDKKVYKDLIIPPPKSSSAIDPADEQMSIYDLTRPCPVFCDKTSPLY